MDDQMKSAFIVAQAACANAELMAMQAANAQTPDDQPYNYEAFMAVQDKYMIGHNTVISYLMGY